MEEHSAGRIDRLIVGLARVFAVIAALSIVVVMVAISTDVVVRYLTHASVPGLVELSESALIVAVFMGLAWAGVEGAHVSVTLVTDRLSATANRVIDLIIWAVASATLAWLTYATALKAIGATAYREERFGLVRWPLYPWRWVIVVGLFAFLLVALVNLARSLRGKGLLGKDEAQAAIDEHGGASVPVHDNSEGEK